MKDLFKSQEAWMMAARVCNHDHHGDCRAKRQAGKAWQRQPIMDLLPNFALVSMKAYISRQSAYRYTAFGDSMRWANVIMFVGTYTLFG